MRYFVRPDGSYYRAELAAHQLDIEVPERPTSWHVWVGGAWAIDQAKQALAARSDTDETERSDCRFDASIMSLVDQTRAQWRTWVAGNFPSITTVGERNKLGDLFWVVSVGVRYFLRR